MSVNNLEDVLYHSLKDLLSAEKQFKTSLTKLSDAAEDSALADAFRLHQDETVHHIQRLEKAFKLLGRAERAEKCKAADGLTSEGDDAIEEDGQPLAKDVLLAGAGRKTEHYEIASYTDAVSCARTLGHDDIADLLGETLAEEHATARKLEEIAKRLAGSSAA